jgi:hypothetical protein
MTENQGTSTGTMPSPALVQKYLHGMKYPASRDDLINHAQPVRGWQPPAKRVRTGRAGPQPASRRGVPAAGRREQGVR